MRHFRCTISICDAFAMSNFIQIFFKGLVLQSFLFISFAAPQTAADWSQPMQPCWEFSTGEMSSLSPAADNKERIFLPLSDGSLIALETASGKTLWRSEFGGEIVAQPLYLEGKIYVLSRISVEAFDKYIFRAVSSATGLTVSQKQLDLKKTERAFLSASENKLYIFSDEGEIHAFDRSDGTHLWTRNLSAEIASHPLVAENRLIIGTDDKKISFISGSDGVVLNVMVLESPTAGNLQYSAGNLFFGDQVGNVHAYRISENKILWKFRTGAGIVNTELIGENLLATSNDGFVYMLSQKSGDRIWKHRLAGRLIGKALLNHRFLLVQTLDGNVLPVLDSAKGRVVNRIRLADETYTVNGAAGGSEIIIIPTNKGLQAFANKCRSQ